MTDVMIHETPYHMIFIWLGLAVTCTLLIGLVCLLTRHVEGSTFALSDLLPATGLKLPTRLKSDGSSLEVAGTSTVDTIFVLPDISNYTRFMTGTQFSFGHAQHIIFSLINAMISAATKRVQLSKLEGDAALFFVDSAQLTKAELGETLLDIFGAFFGELQRLKDSNICPCRACRHIDDLDLKIFVHRGPATHFKFRGSVDLFGTDVIVLHRIMKNSVTGQRYVMITGAAADSVELPGLENPSVVEEEVAHVGRIKASIFEIDDAKAKQLAIAASTNRGRASIVRETFQKLRENLKSLFVRHSARTS